MDSQEIEEALKRKAAKLERELTPFLNVLRALQGKRPVIIPKESKPDGNESSDSQPD